MSPRAQNEVEKSSRLSGARFPQLRHTLPEAFGIKQSIFSLQGVDQRGRGLRIEFRKGLFSVRKGNLP
jgi:hypothetical protein